MNCLKCGKSVEGQQVFCDDCLDSMADCPVKPGTLVYLPLRETAPAEKKTSRTKKGTPGDRLLQMARAVRWLMVTVAVLSVLLTLVAGILLHNLTNDFENRNIGRNYTTAVSD